MTIEEIKTFLAENKEVPEVQEFLNTMIKVPSAEELVRIPEVQKVIDQKVSLGINGFKEKTLPGILETERKKISEPTVSPEMQRIQELEKKLAEKERTESRGNQKNKIVKSFSEKNLPIDFADYLIGDSDEETDQKLTTFMESFGKYEQKIREEILKGHSTVVPKEKESTKFTKEPGAGATKEQWAEYTRAQLRNKE
jgi:hypothetical protein